MCIRDSNKSPFSKNVPKQRGGQISDYICERDWLKDRLRTEAWPNGCSSGIWKLKFCVTRDRSHGVELTKWWPLGPATEVS